MPVFIAEKVLCNYTCGIYIIDAPNIEEARRRIVARGIGEETDSESFVEENHMDELLKNLREVRPCEIISVYGGG